MDYHDLLFRKGPPVPHAITVSGRAIERPVRDGLCRLLSAQPLRPGQIRDGAAQAALAHRPQDPPRPFLLAPVIVARLPTSPLAPGSGKERVNGAPCFSPELDAVKQKVS